MMIKLLAPLLMVLAAADPGSGGGGPGPGGGPGSGGGSDHGGGDGVFGRGGGDSSFGRPGGDDWGGRDSGSAFDQDSGRSGQRTGDWKPPTDRAASERAKVAADAARDQQRYDAERAKILADAAKDPAKAQQDLAKLDVDRAKWADQRNTEYAKIDADLTREQAKISAELDRSSAPVADGSSDDLHTLASAEVPDFDKAGFPVRRGEVEALDLSSAGMAQAKAAGFRPIEHVELRRLGQSIDRLAVPPGMSLDQAVAFLRTARGAAAVDLSHYYGMQPAGEQAEPAPAEARLVARAGRARIGLVDTGVSAHPVFDHLKLDRRSFGAGVRSASEHGTAVASILASEGASKLLVADVFRTDPTGRPYTSADSIAAALDWLARSDVPVINMSLAGPRNAILDSMIIRTLRTGVSVVAAAGNGGPTAPPAYPAALSPVVAVTAVDPQLRVYRYANRGAYVTIAAPGVHELAARAGGTVALFSGTSFAAPHVTAWMARCLGSRNAGLRRIADCRAQMIHDARDLGEPGPDPIYGYGLIR